MIRLGRQWTSNKTFDKVLQRIAEIEAGKMPPESLVCLDPEFDIQDHYVHEIAMCTLFIKRA
jgi:hypothetical protein